MAIHIQGKRKQGEQDVVEGSSNTALKEGNPEDEIRWSVYRLVVLR